MHRYARTALVTTSVGLTVVGALYGALWYMDRWGLIPSADDGFEAARTLPTVPSGLGIVEFATVDGVVTNLIVDPTQPGSMLVTLLDGRIVRLDRDGNTGSLFGDLRAKTEAGGEQGLLGIAVSNDFSNDRQVYLNYTNVEGDTVVARYRVDSSDQIDVAGEEVLLHIEQPFANHNGGQLAFGPDGMLYIGTGDGGSGGDPLETAERLDTLLGKILRIDVGGASSYAIPPGNPFATDAEALPEIWAWGVRNPWRFSFDPATGDLYVADVGQGRWEEVTVIEADTPGGLDLGWDHLEGSHCYEPQTGCETEGRTMPVFTYGHELGCSITGGVVLPERYGALAGHYVMADLCSGLVWTISREADGWRGHARLKSPISPTTFGIDADGNVLIGGATGQIVRISHAM